MTKDQRQFNRERIVFPTNGCGTTGFSHAKKKIDTDPEHTIHLLEKLIQNGS